MAPFQAISGKQNTTARFLYTENHRAVLGLWSSQMNEAEFPLYSITLRTSAQPSANVGVESFIDESTVTHPETPCHYRTNEHSFVLSPHIRRR